MATIAIKIDLKINEQQLANGEAAESASFAFKGTQEEYDRLISMIREASRNKSKE